MIIWNYKINGVSVIKKNKKNQTYYLPVSLIQKIKKMAEKSCRSVNKVVEFYMTEAMEKDFTKSE